MDIRLVFAIWAGKIISFLTKITGGGATAAPGLYALKIDKNLVKKLSLKIKSGSIVISATNGKTTTARLVSSILSSQYKLIHNRQGSNLLRGVASTLIANSSILGKINGDLALWEADEAAFEEIVKNTKPKIICLINLFRDQLDRYGEVDSVRLRWQRTLEAVDKNTTLILNADDPSIAFLKTFAKARLIFFGVEDKTVNLPAVEQIADIRNCLNCESRLSYSSLLSAHLGNYACTNCDFKRPKPQVSASNLKFNSDYSAEAQFSILNSQFSIKYSLPGLFNVYNILASASIVFQLNNDPKITEQKIKDFKAAFGRFQKIKVGDKKAIIFLIKNPTGSNEVLRTIAVNKDLNLLTILNDNIADGKDVSWIWDSNWEILANKTKNLTVSGIRAWDMATRLKYAGFKLSKNDIYDQINYSLEKSLAKMNNKDTLLILPTYTAMLELQSVIQKMSGGTKWHKD